MNAYTPDDAAEFALVEIEQCAPHDGARNSNDDAWSAEAFAILAARAQHWRNEYIRRAVASGSITQAELGRRLNMTRGQINNITRGRS